MNRYELRSPARNPLELLVRYPSRFSKDATNAYLLVLVPGTVPLVQSPILNSFFRFRIIGSSRHNNMVVSKGDSTLILKIQHTTRPNFKLASCIHSP